MSDVVHLAPVVTMDPARPRASAFAVRGDRIIAVGEEDEVRRVVPDARVETLDGVVLPGLIDAHHHMQRGGLKALDYLDEDADVDAYIRAMRDSFDDDGPEHPPFDDRLRAIERIQPLLHALGITGVVDPATTPDEMRAYQESHRRGALTMRTLAMPFLDIGSAETPDVDAVITRLAGTGVSTGFGDDVLRIGPLKVYLDGEALKGQALLHEPWDDSGYRGFQRVSDEDYLRLVAWCASHGWGVGTHAVGSAAVELVVRAAEAGGEAAATRRFQAIHAYLEPGADVIARAAEADVIASLQPSIIWHNGKGLREKLGARAESANPVRRWLDANARVAFGSDGPFFAFDPRHLMWQAVTRRIEGSDDPLSLDQAITIDEALVAYTTAAAHASLAEESRGAIRPGMYADWALWSHDPTREPIDAFRDLRVRRTDVGGRTVFEEAS